MGDEIKVSCNRKELVFSLAIVTLNRHPYLVTCTSSLCLDPRFPRYPRPLLDLGNEHACKRRARRRRRLRALGRETLRGVRLPEYPTDFGVKFSDEGRGHARRQIGRGSCRERGGGSGGGGVSE